MKIMLLTNDLPVIDFNINLDKKIISNINVVNSDMARIYLDGNIEINYNDFESLMQKYMGGTYDLKEYLNHIKQYGFYTPYRPNLRIKIVYM